MVKLNPNKIKVYQLAIDGRGRDAGYTIPEISKRANITEEGVRNILNQLESADFVRRIPGTKRPIFYKRGPKANIMDQAIVDIKSKIIDDGTVKTKKTDDRQDQEILTIVKSVILTNVPTQRAHLNGRVTLDVIKIGDMQEIKIPDEEGGFKTYELFPKQPYRDHHNTRSWKTKIVSDGVNISIELFEAKEHAWLYVFPPELELTSDQLTSANDLMIKRAEHTIAVLTKFGGWQLGRAELVGKVEFADPDNQLLHHVPDMPRSKKSEIWTDRSHGLRELETNVPTIAEWLSTFPKKVEQIENNQQGQSSNISLIERSLEHIVTIYEKQIKLKQLENESIKSAPKCIEKISQDEETCASGISKGVQGDNGVMYR